MQPLRPVLTYVYSMCVCMFVSKEEDKEDQLVDWFVFATIQKRKQADYCHHLHFTPQFLTSRYYLENVYCAKMSCAFQSLQLKFLISRCDHSFIQIWYHIERYANVLDKILSLALLLMFLFCVCVSLVAK